MGSDIRKLLAEGENLLGKTKTEIRKNREKCVDCKERDSVDGSTRCAICLPIHTQAVEQAREGRRLKRENKPTLIYKDGKLVYEHRVVMEGIIGRSLSENEVVTWRNGVKNDNRPENLILALRAGVPLDTLSCPHCSQPYYTNELSLSSMPEPVSDDQAFSMEPFSFPVE